MNEEVAVKRYAEAFVDFAGKSIGLDKALEDFKALKSIMRDNPDFKEVLHTPQLPLTEKFDFLEQILKEGFSSDTINFLKLLLEKRRIELLADILDYTTRHYAHPGLTTVLLKTSFLLDLEDMQAIKDRLEKKLNKKVKLYIQLDAELLGGLQVIIGNMVIDGSVRARLQDLRETLLPHS